MQFPDTLKLLEAHGVETFLYKNVIGWEHGNLKDIGIKSKDGRYLSYEARAFGQQYDWANYEAKLYPQIETVFDALQPNLLLVWNGHTLPMTQFVRAAHQHQIPIRFLERGLFPGSIFIDAQGTNARASFCHQSSYPKHFRSIGEQVCRVFQEQYQPVVAYKSTTTHQSPWIKGGTKALFIEQLDHDTNIVLFSDAFPTNEDAIAHILETHQSAHIQLVIKEHPEQGSKPRTSKHFRELRVNNGDLRALLMEADLVLTRNSSVGFEALVFGKPVIALGQAFYSNFTVQHARDTLASSPTSSREELHAFVGQIFVENHIFTDTHISQIYPPTGAMDSLLPRQLQLNPSNQIQPKKPAWRNRLIKNLGTRLWQLRLRVRSLKARLRA